VESVFYNTTKTPYPWSTVYLPDEDLTDTAYSGDINIYPPGMSHDGRGYGVTNETMVDLVFIFDQVFPSLITVADPTAQPFLKVRTSFVDRVMYRAFKFNPWLAPNNVTSHMERIATAITNVARSEPGSNEFIAGQAFVSETYVQVNWAWLTFPLVMLALCVVFLVATIFKTSYDTGDDIGIWKTSAMPTLLYSLPPAARDNLTTATTTWQSTDSRGAKKVKIRLVPKQGWRVSGQHITTPTLFQRSNPQPPPGWV
jgi:hypothetical protein